MNCAFHADVENTAFCIRCGKPICDECIHRVQSSIYCKECVTENPGAAANPGNAGAEATSHPIPASQSAGGTSPEAAFLLGLMPGVGAIYNGEYFKALLHLFIFGTLITIANAVDRHGEALFGFLAFGFYAYMPFEAYYTAKKRKLAREGINLITPFDQLNEQLGQFGDIELWGGIGLVLAGTLFLLDNFEIVNMEEVGKFWPALLILIGVFFISRFLKGNRA
jgi:hypothetical protein